MDYIKNKYNFLKNKILNMTNIQKLYLAIIFLIIIFILTKLMSSFNTNTLDINYKEITGSLLYPLTNEIIDKDVYVQLKSIADEFISICGGNFYKDNTNVTVEEIYASCLYDEYKRSISKSDFINASNNFYSKLTNDNSVESNYIPYNITQFKGDFYLVRYNYDIDNSTSECYLGIALSSSENKYYIWFVE